MTILYATLLPPSNVYNYFLGFGSCFNKKIAILLTILSRVLKNFQENHNLSTAFQKANFAKCFLANTLESP